MHRYVSALVTLLEIEERYVSALVTLLEIEETLKHKWPQKENPYRSGIGSCV